MQHESTQKLFGGDGHLALLAAVGIVFPAEGDLAVGHIQNPMVGDGDAVSVTRQVLKDVLRPSERAFGIDHPILTKEGAEESVKGVLSGQRLKSAGEHECALLKGKFQAGDKFAAKDTAQYLHGQEERVARMDPALVVERQTTSRDHTMNVRMMQQILAPGMEHTHKADFRSEVFGVGSHP